MKGTWQLTNPSTTQAKNQGYESAHPKIHRIYKLLKHVKGTNLEIQKSRISMTQENRISKKIPSESPLAVVYQKPEASSPTNDSKMLETKNE